MPVVVLGAGSGYFLVLIWPALPEKLELATFSFLKYIPTPNLTPALGPWNCFLSLLPPHMLLLLNFFSFLYLKMLEGPQIWS